MRYALVIASAICMITVAGCGGGSDIPDGYSIEDGWLTSPTGLKSRIITLGTGTTTSTSKSVSVIYKGWLDDGTVFDSNEDPANPFTFTIGVGQVIKGWDEGLLNVPSGSTVELIVPPTLGYGDQDQGPIPANSTLHFWVRIIRVQ